MTTQDQIIVLKLGDREYELVPFLESGETSIRGNKMVGRAVHLDANLGEEDARFILAHQSEIPTELRVRIIMVFTAWRYPGYPHHVAYFRWRDGQWVLRWLGVVALWGVLDRLVRRRLPTGEAGK